MYLNPNEKTMSDRGFTIGEEVFSLQVGQYNIPNIKQLSQKVVVESRRIASLRIYVLKAIRRMDSYRILNSFISITSVKKMNDIVKMIGALCNLRPQLIKDKLSFTDVLGINQSN